MNSRLAHGPKSLANCLANTKGYFSGICGANMAPDQDVKRTWKYTDCVCFDVDSTVIQEEGIDELAKFCGKGPEISQLTTQAMSGGMSFQEALKARLDIIKPSTTQIQDFLRRNPVHLTPGIKKLVSELQDRNIPVYLVSGGFHSLITSIAAQIGVPFDNIFANKLLFYFTGEYAGFKEDEPTSRTGGKAVVAELLKQKCGYKNLVFIGDGATDLEACPPADGFIGFGGNVVRERVKTKAKWYVTDFNELITELRN